MSEKWIRIQRRRTKGWKMPPNTVYVGRPTKWGNPFSIGSHGRNAAVNLYHEAIDRRHGHSKVPMPEQIRAELRGKDLACWCPLDQPCHADVLLEIANAPVPDTEDAQK